LGMDNLTPEEVSELRELLRLYKSRKEWRKGFMFGLLFFGCSALSYLFLQIVQVLR